MNRTIFQALYGNTVVNRCCFHPRSKKKYRLKPRKVAKMASGEVVAASPSRKSVRRFARGIFCCSCLKAEQEDISVSDLHLDGEGEMGAILIMVEDLGIDNMGFRLFDEDPLGVPGNLGRSPSSVSACLRALNKKKLKRLFSLPNHPVQDSLETRHFPSGSLQTAPTINLIPSTPSDGIDDDQFFDSEESVPQASASEGSFDTGECKSDDEEQEDELEHLEKEEGSMPNESSEDRAEIEGGSDDQLEEEGEAVPDMDEATEKLKCRNLQETDPDHRNVGCCDTLKSDLSLPPHAATMDTFTHQRRRITRSCSLEERVSRSNVFDSLGGDAKPPAASHVPQRADQNGNFSQKDVDGQKAKSLRELNADEVCQWFTRIGLPKYLPFIREANLCGANIASIDMSTLDVLHVSSLEDKEKLLSAIYDELHPHSTITKTLDSLLESSDHVETFAATLASMSKSKSSPHVSCLSMNRRSLRSNNHSYAAPRNPKLMEISINASERIVHLRTPTETTVAKVMDSCLKMLGMTEDRSSFSLRIQKDAPAELSQDQHIGSLLSHPAEITQLELHLCKKDMSTRTEVIMTNENKNVPPAKEERIRELNQQVDSLQNVILQVQELHLGLVAFCSEIKNMDVEVNVDQLSSAELKQKLESVRSRLSEKRGMLLSLRDNTNNSNSHKEKQMDVRLLEKMKMNCQVFKEEIIMVHLNRQMAHLQNALQETFIKEKAPKKSPTVASLSQLVSPQSPAMMFVVEENRGPDGCYGFTCGYREGRGLVVIKAEESHLCLDDRLVEVNGVQVINSTEEDLRKLLQVPSAMIVVLRQPPPPMTFRQHSALLQHVTDPPQKHCSEKDVIAVETPSQRKLMAI